MTDRPILFSAPMVRALLDGRKTQTRRILKDQPGDLDKSFMMDDGSWHVTDSRGGHMSPLAVRFRKGDRLWVRETFSFDHSWTGVPPRDVIPAAPVHYWADGNPTDGDWTKPKPGIHMPQWVSRLTLTVTDVRVQRLNQMTEADAIAEGVECYEKADAPLVTFAKLWNAINKDERHSWQNNPWVCAVTFRPELNSAKCQG